MIYANPYKKPATDFGKIPRAQLTGAKPLAPNPVAGGSTVSAATGQSWGVPPTNKKAISAATGPVPGVNAPPAAAPPPVAPPPAAPPAAAPPPVSHLDPTGTLPVGQQDVQTGSPFSQTLLAQHPAAFGNYAQLGVDQRTQFENLYNTQGFQAAKNYMLNQLGLVGNAGPVAGVNTEFPEGAWFSSFQAAHPRAVGNYLLLDPLSRREFRNVYNTQGWLAAQDYLRSTLGIIPRA